MNVQEALSNWDRSFHKSDKTKRAYTNGLKVFIAYLQEAGVRMDAPVGELKADLFINFPAWIGGRYSKKSLGVYLSGVRSFLNWLTIQRKIELTWSEGERLKMATREVQSKREVRLPRFPKRDDAQRMIDGVRAMAASHPVEKLRNIAIIILLASSGCRNEEITKLKVGEVNLEERSTTVIGKGNKERRVFFSHEAAQALREYLAARDARDEQPLFVRHDQGVGDRIEGVTTATIRDVVKAVANYVGLKQFSPHWFRHAYAIRVLEQTGNLALVQDLLGHSDPASTRVYAKIYGDSMKSQYEKVFA